MPVNKLRLSSTAPPPPAYPATSLLTEPALAGLLHTQAPHLVVIASAEENVVGRGVPLNQPHTPAVSMEVQERLSHVPLQPALRDLPDPHLRKTVWALVE